MSETTVPLWKQELLQRRERNAKLRKQENLHSVFEASSRSTTINNHFSSHETERKSGFPFGRQRGLEQKMCGVTINGSSVINCGPTSEGTVDGFANDTRRIENQGSRLSSPFIINNSSRLDQPNESSSQVRNMTGKYNKNGPIHASVNTGKPEGMSRLDREYSRNKANSLNSIAMDESERENLKSFVGVDRGVDEEHIRPKDVKKMWKRQESKEELYPQQQNTKENQPKKSSSVNHIEKPDSVEVTKKHGTVQGGKPIGHLNQGGSMVSPSNAPKAYKSPYAKKDWVRRGTVGDKKPVKKNHEIHPPISNGPVKTPMKETLEINSSCSNDLTEKVESHHLQSVKSLLGLFGGSTNRRKHHDDSYMVKTEKQIDGGQPVSPTSKALDYCKPTPARHRSEPILYSRNEAVSNAPVTHTQNVKTSQSNVDSETFSHEPVVSPSHHVSRGIEERMSCLRRASHSSMEDLVKDDPTSTSDGSVLNQENKQNRLITSKNYNSDPKEVLAEKSLSSNMNNKELSAGGSSIGNTNLSNLKKENMYIKENSAEKLNKKEECTVSSYVNDDNSINQVSGRIISSGGQLKVNHGEGELSKGQGEEDKTPKQSFDKLLSVFGPRASKKSSSDVNDIKASKSIDKYLNKQNNYVIEVDQSGGGLQDQCKSTEHSNGIIKNQQKDNMVIKTNEATGNEAEKKVEKKSRRSVLNVVDPLEVLKLTKDPILLKGKPPSPDIGLIKDPQSGRKPTVEIIKSQPDNKAKIAQINRAWDLNHVQPSLPSNHVSSQTLPSTGTQQMSPEVKSRSKNIPVTSIDDIPVSSIDDVVESETKSNVPEINTDPPHEVKFGNTTFYTGTLTSESLNHEGETEEEIIPVSSIDDDSTLLPPPEIIFEKDPQKVKSCFIGDRMEKRGNVSFFQHVFIHDYQSETAATADWDFENGQAFGSYTPAAVRQYTEIDIPDNVPVAPVPTVDDTTATDGPRNDEPNIIYNEEDSMDFSESSDSTAGALLF